MNGRFSDKTARFRWQIRCVPSRVVITKIDIKQLYDRPQTLSASFEKPDLGCEAQTIQLMGLQSNRLNRVKIYVKKVEINSKSSRNKIDGE